MHTHKLAEMLPPMRDSDYKRLKDDIAKDGLIDPITMYEGKIIDGVHRQAVCEELGIKARYEDFIGDDPARFVFSKNLSRRHLSNSQLAMVGAELEEHFAKAARRRQTAGLKRGNKSPVRANRPTRRNRAQDDAAEVVGTSRRSIARAKRIKHKRPDLAAEIKTGKMSVSAADGIISADKKQDKVAAEKTKKRQPRWSGKRLRELHADKRNGDTSDFNKLQREIAMAVQALETFDIPDLDWDEGMNGERFGFVYEDLTELDKWVITAQAITASHMDEMSRQRTIKNIEARRDHPNTDENERRACERALERLRNKRLLAEGE